MTPAEQAYIATEVISTSKSLEEISERLKIIIEVTKLKTRSLYLYDKVLDQYFIETNEDRFYTHQCNKSVKELTKTEYFEATLPDWGIDIINCLDE